MISELIDGYQLSKSEYYRAVRMVVHESLQDAPVDELDYIVESAMEQMTEDEANEFWGAIASIAKAVAPHALRFGKRIIGRIAGRRRSRRGRRPRRQRPGLSKLMQIMQDTRFLSLLAGNNLNKATGRTVGRTRVRRRRRSTGGRREMTHVTLQEFGSLISFFSKHLAGVNQGGLSASVANEYGAFTENYGEADEVEHLMQELYGEELVSTEESYSYGGFEGDSEYSGLESFSNYNY